MDKTYRFVLMCACGREIKGVIPPAEKRDILHCICGLVWTVLKPVREVSHG